MYPPVPVYDDQGPSTYGQPPAPSYAPLQQGDPGLLQVPAPPQLAPFETFRDVRCSVAMGWKADIIGSLRAFPLLTDTVEKVLVNFGEQ